MNIGGTEILEGALQPRPILDQGARGMCLAMAATASHEQGRSAQPPLSPEALWQHVVANGRTGPGGSGTTVRAVELALTDTGQPTLADWPFDPATQDPQARPAGLLAPPWFRGALQILPPEVSAVRSLVSVGEAPLVGMRLAGQFYTVGSDGLIDPIAPRDPDLGGHALAVVATGTHASRGELFAVRNSWGTGWGAGGYAWIDEGSLAARLGVVARVRAT